MIRSHFGIDQNPFETNNIELLTHQKPIFDTIKVLMPNKADSVWS